MKLIRKLKPTKQFLFATQDAVFSVLGDAERIVSCTEHEEAFEMISDGIDSKECQDRIVEIKESGPEAFERRGTIYQL